MPSLKIPLKQHYMSLIQNKRCHRSIEVHIVDLEVLAESKEMGVRNQVAKYALKNGSRIFLYILHI
jgi:S-adenosylhomocysteine hydrolase